MERSGENQGIRPPPRTQMENGRSFPPHGPSYNNSPRPNVQMPNDNAMPESQVRMDRMDPGTNFNRNVPMNPQMVQPRIIPPNVQQGPRFPPNENPMRFANNQSMGNPNVRPSGGNQPNTGFNWHPFPEQRPRFPNSVPVMQPLMSERQSLSRQPSNQSLSGGRQTSNQQMDLQQNHNLINRHLVNEKHSGLPGENSNLNAGASNRPTHNEFAKNDSDLELNEGLEREEDEEEEKAQNEENDDEEEEEVENDQLISEHPETEEPDPEFSSGKSFRATTKNSTIALDSARKSNLILIDDETLQPGLVSKNIKFFEEHDTAKKPLIPRTLSLDKREPKTKRKQSAKSSKSDEDEGVDESPMYHPNLRSILDTPFKLAKIPLYKYKKNKNLGIVSDKSRITGRKKPFLWSESVDREKNIKWLSNTSESSKYRRNPKHHPPVRQQKSFKPDEELLAFFHTSKSLKMKLGEKSSQERDKSGSKPTTNGDIQSAHKSRSRLPGPAHKSPLSLPTDSPLKSPGTPRAKSVPKTPENPTPPTPTNKKLPMNKIQVGAAPSPNLRAAKSKVGSLVNTTHKPGGGNVRIESHKIDFSKTQSRIEAKNDQYVRSGGDKKIPQVKLQWEAKSKVGSLENSTYKPGGGDKKIESMKLDFKEKAKSKVGSKDNVKHVPGGGMVKIESQKLEFKAQSKVGSLDNVKHKPGGGDVKIFDDKTYLRQISATNSEGGISGTQSFGDFGVIRDRGGGRGGRSVPGTPGHKAKVRIRRTTIVSGEDCSSIDENVLVPPKTPVKQRKPQKMDSTEYQEVKINYVRTAPGDNAPLLKSDLSKTDAAWNGHLETVNAENSINFANLDSNKDKMELSYTRSFLDKGGKSTGGIDGMSEEMNFERNSQKPSQNVSFSNVNQYQFPSQSSHFNEIPMNYNNSTVFSNGFSTTTLNRP